MEQANIEERRTLMDVALGREKADLVIAGGDLVNVYSGEILKGYSVAIKGEKVAAIGEELAHTIGLQTEVIDASGKTIIPGLIDGHTHLAGAPAYYSPYEFLRHVIKGGTTTIITETMEMAFAQGYSGLLDFVESLQNQPIKCFVTIPPMISLGREKLQNVVDTSSLEELMRAPVVVGLGEAYWQTVLENDSRFWALSSSALESGKTIEGHSAGARKEKLSAYLCSGVSSCHEATDSEEAIERLRQGIFVMIREGSIRRELEAISKLKDRKIDFRRMVLVTDAVASQELQEKGYMEYVVQKAIDLGFDPVVAIQMASLNPAEHFHLDGFLGGIAPGRCADILIIPNPRTIRAEYVISNGKVVAREGELLVEPKRFNFSAGNLKGFRRVVSRDFAIAAGKRKHARVRAISQITNLVTREFIAELPVLNGEVKPNPNEDILKVTLLSDKGKIFTGFIRGFGLRQGAVAMSCPWDTCAIASAGASDEDLAGAINRVVELGGGIVVYADNEVRAELPLPVAGLFSELPLEAIVQRLEEVQGKLSALGCPLSDPVLSLATLASPAIPFLRLSENGLIDIKSGRVVDLVVG